MRFPVAVVLLVPCLFGVASAQQQSDLMPEAPQPSGQQAAPWYPGSPLPPAPEGSSSAAPARTPAGASPAAESKKGLVLYDRDVTGSGQEIDYGDTVSTDAPAPETYVVRKGDTLWEISGRFFHNPWTWPKLWALNPSITNPHWIYPGDVLRLRPAGLEPPPVAGAPTEEPVPHIGKMQRPSELQMRNAGFVEEAELQSAARIIGSKEELMLLSTLDQAYAEHKDEGKFKAGERYAVYHPVRQVRHPKTGKKLGWIVEIVADFDVKSLEKNKLSRGVVMNAVMPVERGYLVGPLKRRYTIPAPRPNDKLREATLIASLKPFEVLGPTHVVFIDLGKKDGVEVGNRFFVVRRGDGVQPLLARGAPVETPTFPQEKTAELMVVELRDSVSTCILTHAEREAFVGDKLEAPKGY